MALNKIYICLPSKKEIDKLDWDGLPTEEYNGKTYYKILLDFDDNIVKKITFETLEDNVTIKLNIINIKSHVWSEAYAYACDLDSYSSDYYNAKYKVTENDQLKICEYVVPTKGSHWIYIGYRNESFDESCGYFNIDYDEKNYVISKPKEVYLASDKINKITYGSIKILYPGFNNTISWETLTWDKTNNTYTYNSKGPLKMNYKNLGSSTSSSISLNNSPAEMPNNGQIDNIVFDNGQSGSIQIMPYKIDLSDWDSTYVTNIDSMFSNCSKLTSLDVSEFKTSSVTSMNYMFYNCNVLTSLDASNWNVSKVNNMNYMFNNCSGLTSLIDGHESDPNVVALNGLKVNLDLHYSTKLNYESVYALFRGLAKVKKTITLPKVMNGKLDATKVKIATDKGWTIKYS